MFEKNHIRAMALSVPSELVGCWKHLSGPSKGFPHLQIVTNGAYFVGDEPITFSIDSSGMNLNWRGVNYLRHLGAGVTIHGSWRAVLNGYHVEHYFRDDNTFVSTEDGISEQGKYTLVNNTPASDVMHYWRQRAQIIGVTPTNQSSEYLVTANSVFGGTFTFIMRIKNGNLEIESENLYTYETVDCLTLK